MAQVDPELPFELTAAGSLLLRIGGFLAGFVAVLIVGWYVLDPLISRVVIARNRDNPTLQEAISRYVRILVLGVALFVGVGSAGFGRVLSDSAVVFAAGTLALGVAGQAVIGSLVSGVALVVDPQFNIGNYIRWSGGEGEVKSITLRVTRVQTPDGGLVTIPNTTLTDESITRPFEGRRGRVVERIGVAYGDDVDRAVEVLVGTAAGVDGVLADPAPEAAVDELGGDAVVLRASFWVEDPRRNRFRARQTFVRRVNERLEAAGIGVSPATKRDIQGRIEVEDVA